MIYFGFDDGDNKFIVITRYSNFQTNNQEKQRLSFNKTSLKLEINLINNFALTWVACGFVN